MTTVVKLSVRFVSLSDFVTTKFLLKRICAADYRFRFGMCRIA